MSSKLHYAFTCPKCGFHGWGTSNCDKPFDQWFGHCNASGCGFSWHRETADHVYLKESTQTRINQTMMTKEEMLEMAEKCGAKPYPGKLPTDEIFIEFTYSELLAYTYAIEEKHQAQNIELQKQIARLREGFKRIVSESINAEYIAEEMLTTTQATSDAWEAEVKAGALEYAADECRKEASEIFGAKADGAWLCEERLRRRAAELRNQQPEQPRNQAKAPITTESATASFTTCIGMHQQAQSEQPRNQEQGECITYSSSSRICQHGTKSCIVEHVVQQPRKPCTCDGWCDGLCLEKEEKRK